MTEAPVTKRDLSPKTLADLRAQAQLLGEIERIPLGIADDLHGGGAPGWFIGVGAFTGGGKTTLLTAMAIFMAMAGHPVLIVSLELAGLEVVRKIDAACYPDCPDLNISIFDGSSYLDDILRVITEWVEQFDGGLCPVVLVDFIQKVSCPGTHGREREVATVAESLQILARRLGFLIISAIQLNRFSQEREKPKISDLRESGVLEQVCDLILLAAKTDSDRIRIEVGKHRWGASGAEVELHVDFARCQLGALRPDQVYAGLTEPVLEALSEGHGKAKVRDITRSVWWGPRGHPSKADLERAGEAFGLWKVLGSEVVKVKK